VNLLCVGLYSARMSDYEEEHFPPVGIRTSFSSTFDADWRDSAGVTDFAPIRRSFSEFYRGERITVDTDNHECEFRNVTSKEEIQNVVGDDDSDLDNLNVSAVTNLGSGTVGSCVTVMKNNVCRDDVQSRSFQPEFDMQIDSLVSEHCSMNSECANGYHGSDASTGTKVYSYAENGGATVSEYDSLSRTGPSGRVFAYSQRDVDNANDVIRHRTVSEIRNNIPDVGSAKSCSDAASEIGRSSPDMILRGEFARFHKRSPGVAKRLEATTPSHSESVDLSLLSLQEVCEVDEAAIDERNPEGSSSSSSQPLTVSLDTVPAGSKVDMTVAGTDSADGMCIEKASTKHRELGNVVVESSRMWETRSDDSARISDPFRYSGMLPDAVLFTTSDDPVADQTIRLSPELTECDSDNVSTLEEDITVDVIDGCLPVVEDGLSCSDTDEIHTSAQTSSPSNFSSATQSDTALDSSVKFPVSETEVMDFFSGTADSPRVKDDAVERAIRDIRLAMERSKRFAAGSPAKPQQSARRDVESVWVSRAE